MSSIIIKRKMKCLSYVIVTIYMNIILISHEVRISQASSSSSQSQSTATSKTKSYFDIPIPKNETQPIAEDGTIPRPKPRPRAPQTDDEIQEFKLEQSRRMKERREKAREKMKEMIKNPNEFKTGKTEKMTEEQINSLREEIQEEDPHLEKEEHRWLRNRNSNSNTRNNKNDYDLGNLADPGEYYSEWAQAYRMLGAFISCDDGGVGYYGGRNYQGCSRYIMWAAYVDPNYQGYGRNEYFGYSKGNNKNNNYYGEGCQRGDDGSYHCYSSNVNNANANYYSNNKKNNGYTDPVGTLDCHSVDSKWLLMGVYRQEFYEFFEQITKHMWYYNDYEYIVAYTGLSYLNDGDCNLGGYDYNGDEIYAAPKPLEGGSFEMGLYKDYQCLLPHDSDDRNYDQFFGNYYSKEDWNVGDDDYYAKANAQARTQEYTMTLFNEVFEGFKYCTLCIDYPSYQDGYFNGNYGTDEDDLINQCWKFYSHDTYHCTHECIALGDAQGTITELKYGDRYYGRQWDGQTGDGKYTKYDSYSKEYVNSAPSKLDRARANVFLIFNMCLLTLTYYASLHAARFRNFIGFDDHQESGLGGLGGKGGKSKNKKALLSSKHKGNHRDADSVHSVMSEPPWLGMLKNIFLGDEELRERVRDPRSTATESRMREQIDPQRRRGKKKSRTSTKSLPENFLKDRSRGKLDIKADVRFIQEALGKQRTRSQQKTRLTKVQYEPPKLKKTKVSTFDKAQAEKAVVKVMEKHKNSFHAVKVASGSGERKITVDRNDTRLAKESERKKGTHERSQPPPQIIIENLPAILEE